MTGKRVLVIDDEELALYSMREILEGGGYEVVEARNGREGVEAQKRTPCDAVVADIIMPEKEGVETITELKAAEPDLGIVAVSGGGRTRDLDFLRIAQDFGADKAIAKPFSEQDLLDAVGAVLR